MSEPIVPLEPAMIAAAIENAEKRIRARWDLRGDAFYLSDSITIKTRVKKNPKGWQEEIRTDAVKAVRALIEQSDLDPIWRHAAAREDSCRYDMQLISAGCIGALETIVGPRNMKLEHIIQAEGRRTEFLKFHAKMTADTTDTASKPSARGLWQRLRHPLGGGDNKTQR